VLPVRRPLRLPVSRCPGFPRDGPARRCYSIRPPTLSSPPIEVEPPSPLAVAELSGWADVGSSAKSEQAGRKITTREAKLLNMEGTRRPRTTDSKKFSRQRANASRITHCRSAKNGVFGRYGGRSDTMIAVAKAR